MPTTSQIRRARGPGRPASGSRRLVWLYPVVVTAWLLAPSQGSQTFAQATPSLTLEWSAPPGCPEREEMERALNRHLHASAAALATLQVRTQIVRAGSDYRLNLEIQTERGHAKRTLVNPQCGPLVDAAAVLIALAIDPNATQITTGEASVAQEAEDAAQRPPQGQRSATETTSPRAEQPMPSDSDRTAAPTELTDAPLPAAGAIQTERAAGEEPEQATDEEPEPAADADLPAWSTVPSHGPDRLRLWVAAALRADVGSFPHSPAFGAQAQMALRFAAVYTGLGFSYWPAQAVSSEAYPGARLLGSGLFADWSLGLEMVASPLQLTVALDVELGQLRAEAIDIAGPESHHVLWSAIGASMLATVLNLESWNIGLELTALVPTFRTQWLVRTPQGEIAAHVSAPLVVRLSLRVSYALW